MGSLDAAPIWARSTPFSSAARAPPGSLIRSPTSTIVPTLANSSPLRGTSTTRSSSPTSTARVTDMFGKTTESSTGISTSVCISLFSIRLFFGRRLTYVS